MGFSASQTSTLLQFRARMVTGTCTLHDRFIFDIIAHPVCRPTFLSLLPSLLHFLPSNSVDPMFHCGRAHPRTQLFRCIGVLHHGSILNSISVPDNPSPNHGHAQCILPAIPNNVCKIGCALPSLTVLVHVQRARGMVANINCLYLVPACTNSCDPANTNATPTASVCTSRLHIAP